MKLPQSLVESLRYFATEARAARAAQWKNEERAAHYAAELLTARGFEARELARAFHTARTADVNFLAGARAAFVNALRDVAKVAKELRST